MKKITLNELKALDLNDLYKFYVEYRDCISYIVNHKALYLKRTAKSRAETAAMTKAFFYDRSKVSVVSEFC